MGNVKVYKYGLLPPVSADDSKLADQLLFKAHRFYNVCIEAHRNRALAVRALYGPEVVAAYEAIDAKYKVLGELRDQISLLRSNQPADAKGKENNLANIAALKEQGVKIKAEIDKDKDACKALRQGHWKSDDFKAKVAVVGEQFRAKIKAERAPEVCGLEFGTYNAIIEDAEKATKKSVGLPRFARYEGEGTLSHQMIASATGGDFNQRPEGIFCPQGARKNTYVQIEMAPDSPNRTGNKRKGQYAVLRWLAGGAMPIKDRRYIEFPMVLHRPLPPEGRITGVQLTRRKLANKDVWSVQFVVKLPEVPAVSTTAKSSAIAFDLGWRKDGEDSLRVAYWADTDGNHGEVLLPDSIRQRLHKAEDIRSIRDQNLDNIKVWLKADLASKALSEDVATAVRYLHKWRSPAKFASLYRKHKDELKGHLQGLRLDYKADKHLAKCDDYLQAWLRRDLHLWQYEAGMRQSAIRARNDLYSKIAADSAVKYDVVVFENLKTANLAKLAKPEKKADLPDSVAAMNNASRGQRTIAAPATLMDACKGAAESRGKTFVKVPPANTSKVHAACGHKQTGLGAKKDYVCEGCGAAFDRDHNAAMNILRLGL